jgi:hypothetical protein
MNVKAMRPVGHMTDGRVPEKDPSTPKSRG